MFFVYHHHFLNDCGEFSDILKINIDPHDNISANLSSSVRTCTNILILPIAQKQLFIYGKFNKHTEFPCIKYWLHLKLKS